MNTHRSIVNFQVLQTLSPYTYLSLATIYSDIDTFLQAIGATINALNFETSCRRRQNMPFTWKQIVDANSDMEIKYKKLVLLSHKT